MPAARKRQVQGPVVAGCRTMRKAPEIIEVVNTHLDEVLHLVEQTLDEKDAALIRAVFQSYVYVTDLVEYKNTSIRRLRQLFFGKRTEKTKSVVGPLLLLREVRCANQMGVPSAGLGPVVVRRASVRAGANDRGEDSGPDPSGR